MNMKDIWWTIAGSQLLEMLYRVQRGEDPDLVYMEEYANGDHEFYDHEL